MNTNGLRRGLAAALAALALAGGVAMAGITDLLDPKTPFDAYVGTWTNPDGGLSDIDHMVITAVGSEQVRIQTFGRCGSRICNWGALPGHIRSDNPRSQAVQSISVDYNLGFALRHITLRRAQGSTLQFDVMTDFTDGSARHDYETAGRLVPLGSQAVARTPSDTAAQTDMAGTEIRPVAAASNAAPAPSKPWWDVFGETGGTRASSGPGDCITFDGEHSYVAPHGGNWRLRDFLHTVQDFGPYRVAAAKAKMAIAYYHFDEVCRIGRGSTNLVFYRAAGEVPHTAMPDETCVATHPDKVRAVLRDGAWKVVDGGRELYDYGSNKDAAQQAASAVKVLGFNRQCYFDKDNTPLSYWLSR